MFQFLTLLELRMMEVVVTTEAMRHVKPSHHQTNTQLFTGQMPFLSPNQQHQSTEGKNRHIQGSIFALTAISSEY